MKKLLFMGCSFGTEEALKYAKRIGIYTIITDYYSIESSNLKKMADEFWTIDVANIDELEKKCREENITGIFAATSEFCLDNTKELCHRLNLPFYASDEGWACSRDKERFKKHCIQCGLYVPHSYSIEQIKEINAWDSIHYPVIVKPVDSCAQQGLSICNNIFELEKGIKNGLNYSAIKRITVEEYITGNELAIMYYFVDGKPIPVEIVDMIYMSVNGRNNFVFAKQHSRFQDEYLKNISQKVEKLFQNMKCYNGVAFIQVIRKNGTYYFLELGYRINAGGSWVVTKKMSGISSIEFMVDYALGFKYKLFFDSQTDLNPEHKTGGIYLLWAKPGKIARIEGLDGVNKLSDVEIVLQHFNIGDEIPKETSMRQIAFYIAVVANDHADLRTKIKEINTTLHIYDTQGNDLLLYLTDYKSLERI